MDLFVNIACMLIPCFLINSWTFPWLKGRWITRVCLLVSLICLLTTIMAYFFNIAVVVTDPPDTAEQAVEIYLYGTMIWIALAGASLSLPRRKIAS